jgi:hypothetical protein
MPPKRRSGDSTPNPQKSKRGHVWASKTVGGRILGCASVRECPPTAALGPVLGNVARRRSATYDPPVTDWDWSRVVFDHVKIGVRDAEASRSFYRTVLAALGIPPLWEGEHGGQYANLVVSSKAAPGGPIHIGFVASSRAEVDAFTARGWKLVMPITALPEYARSTAQKRRGSTTPRSCSTRTATTSKPFIAPTFPEASRAADHRRLRQSSRMSPTDDLSGDRVWRGDRAQDRADDLELDV